MMLCYSGLAIIVWEEIGCKYLGFPLVIPQDLSLGKSSCSLNIIVMCSFLAAMVILGECL